MSQYIYIHTYGHTYHGTLKGRELLKSNRLSETPIVWRNTSDTFTPSGLGFNQFLVSAIKRFDLKKCVMVNCVVPVLADNPLA